MNDQEARSAAWVADRLAALNAAANRHGGDHELSAVCSHLHSELPKLAVENERLRAALSRIEHWPFDVGHMPERDLREIREAAHDALA